MNEIYGEKILIGLDALRDEYRWGEGFGTLCIDNLQTYGVVYFAPEGLSFSEGSVLIYPK